jgi:hypothetical protein
MGERATSGSWEIWYGEYHIRMGSIIRSRMRRRTFKAFRADMAFEISASVSHLPLDIYLAFLHYISIPSLSELATELWHVQYKKKRRHSLSAS